MKRILLAISFATMLSTVGLKAQTSQPINIGTIDTINSKILGEQRTAWVYVPNTNSNDKFAKTKYPVIYLLDGEYAFSAVTGMTQYLSTPESGICPEVIVVGITNKNRFGDLTPTHTGPNTGDNITGGGEKLLAYIEKELMPYIDNTYPTLPYKIFVGHSLGGLMVMQAFTHHYNMFNAYVAIEPSLWWDNQKLLKETTTMLRNTDTNDKPFFLGIANPMKAGMDTATVQKDTMSGTLHIRSILELNKLLKATKTNYASRYYENYTHDPSSLTGTYDALLWLFRNFKFNSKQSYYSATSFDTIQSKLETHFSKFSNELGFKYAPPEKLINILGSNALNRKQVSSAEYLFKLNIANYPTSFNAFDAIGDFYAAQNNKDKAIEYFKKALSVKNVEATRIKVTKLESK